MHNYYSFKALSFAPLPAGTYALAHHLQDDGTVIGSGVVGWLTIEDDRTGDRLTVAGVIFEDTAEVVPADYLPGFEGVTLRREGFTW